MRDEDLQLPSPARRARRAGRSRGRFGAGRHVAVEVHVVSLPQGNHGKRRRRRRPRQRLVEEVRRLHRARREGRVPGPRRQREPPWRERLLRRPVGRRPGPRQSPPVRRGRSRRSLFPQRRLCRDSAPPDRGSQYAVPRLRRQHADAAAGLSGRRHGQHAARQHAAAGRHRLQVQAPRSRRHLHRRTGLERQPEPAPRRARGDAAGVGIVLLDGVAIRGAGEREDRRRRAHGRLCDQADAGDGELPVLVLPQRRHRGDLVEPVLPGRAGRDHRPARAGARTTSSSSSGERRPTTSRRRCASAARRRSAG